VQNPIGTDQLHADTEVIRQLGSAIVEQFRQALGLPC
jgi:hypothetical protein